MKDTWFIIGVVALCVLLYVGFIALFTTPPILECSHVWDVKEIGNELVSFCTKCGKIAK